MKKIIINVMIVIFLSAFAQVSIAADKNGVDAVKTGSANDTVAVVNGTKISAKILARKVNMMRQRYLSMGMKIPPEKINALRSKLLSNMIEQEVLYQESRKQGITVKPDQLESELNKIKKKHHP